MPSCTSLVRLLRRRLVLGLIFALSLTYCAFSLLRNEKKELPSLNSNLDMDPMMINDNNEDQIPDDNMLEELKIMSDKSPLWQVEILDRAANDAGNMDASNLNESDAQTCRNSVQGRGLIVDDRGVVCSRHEVLSNGCCTIEQKQTPKNDESLSIARREKYSCKTCNPQGCCTIYEYCVSCCLHPDKQVKSRKDVLLDSVKVQKDIERTPVRNSDRFQICLAACRTSSSSVRHENTYKDPLAKHCYIPQRYRRNLNSLNNNGDNPAVVITSFSVVTLLAYPSPEYHPLFNSITLSILR